MTKYESAECMQQKWEGGGQGRGRGEGRGAGEVPGRVQVAPKQQEKRGVRGGRVEQAGKIKGGRAGGWEMNAKNGFVQTWERALRSRRISRQDRQYTHSAFILPWP